MSGLIHDTIPVKVWADVDIGISALVRYLNTIPGVRTQTSCQGTIGEGGPNPYRPYVMCSWTDEVLARLRQEFDVDPSGDNWGHVMPRLAQPVSDPHTVPGNGQ